jgi:alkylhydroperoxidase family enzyme
MAVFSFSWQSVIGLMLLTCVSVLPVATAEELTTTRPEMKKRIEALKNRTSRLPLPPPSSEEIASGRSLVNNGRLRALYLPPLWQSFLVPGWGSSASRNRTSVNSTLKTLEATPDYAFKTRLFWIVSRTNDCQYCLGHQELKLRRVGMTDDQIASLDSRWDFFPANEQAAMNATRILTIHPHLFGDQQITELKSHFTDEQIIDIIYTVARYNAVNRWTSSTGIPQDQSFGGDEHPELDTPTSAEFASVASKVIPVDVSLRPKWESRDAVEAALAKARDRSPRVGLPSMDTARQLVAKDMPGTTPPVWFQAICKIPVAIDAWAQKQSMAREGKTPIDLRIRISWVTARENRAWYSAGHARARFLASGGDESVLESFEALEKNAEPSHAEALRFARKLTSTPHAIDDADVTRLQTHFSNHEVAEIIQVICDSNGFDRLTEALNLPLEF